MAHYYNEHDLKAAEWLRTLCTFSALPPGCVDDRDVQEVNAEDVERFAQHHFFAGIGGWPLALKMAGWPDGRPVMTASLPCQPFSQAGSQRGQHDDRHLWPHFRELVERLGPPLIFGEQVSSKAAVGPSSYVTKTRSVERLLEEAGRDFAEEPEWSWFATVQADLEDLGYLVGASDLPAASVGAPHIRQRLYWCAYRPGGVSGSGGLAHDNGQRFAQRSQRDCASDRPVEQAPFRDDAMRCGADGSGLANSEARRWSEIDTQPGRSVEGSGTQGRERSEHGGGLGSGLVDTNDPGRQGAPGAAAPGSEGGARRTGRAGGDNPWSDVVWLPCTDGKARPIEPGIKPLVDGLPGRVGLLRGYGNAIVPQVAAEFVRSVMETLRQ